MDELIFSSSSSSLSTSLQHRLQYIVKNQTDWAYAIFWETSNNHLFLTWGDGHLNGKTNNNNNIDVEWFYFMSFAQSFSVGEGVVGKCYSSGSFVWLTGDQQFDFSNCGRAKEAHNVHGINTLVYIPILSGVLELGSSTMIKQDLKLVQQVKSMFFGYSNNYEIIGEIDLFDDFGLFNCLEQSSIDNGTTVQENRVGFQTVEIEVKMVGQDAIIRVQSKNVNFPSTRLMCALQKLELHVHHANISSINDLMLQDIVVKVPQSLETEDELRNALLSRLGQITC